MVDLPFPPSLNHLFRYDRKGVRPSPKYEQWKRDADGLALAQHVHRGHRIIQGRFEATIIFADGRRGDLDNLAKGIFDWAQSRRLIQNDKHCRKLTLEWVEPHRAPEGCRLTLTELA